MDKLLLVSVLYLYLGAATIRGQLQLTDIKVLQSGGTRMCSSMEERERAKNDIHQITNSIIGQIENGGKNATITETLRNDTHQMNDSTTDDAQQIGNSTISNTCGTLGWRRVAFINMTNTSYNCPAGLQLTSNSTRACGRSHSGAGCSSTKFSIESMNRYGQVCGRIRAYQLGETAAFGSYNQGIDNHYVDGISLTCGIADRRQHIWTFAAGLAEVSTHWPEYGCPCDNTGDSDRVPKFVGDDYFCESGVNQAWSNNLALHSDDVLWDGQACTSTSTCCQFNNPPWFTKNLLSATTDDIELRICTNGHRDDIPFEFIELYVQ